MTIQEVAKSYADLINQGKQAEIQDTMYGPGIICREPAHAAAMGLPTLTAGLDAVKAKAMARREMIAEIHGNYCSEPIIAGNHFSVAMSRDITFKNGKRVQLNEIAVFEVRGGKIISETFFY